MRVGQKNSLVYQWAKKGSRPRQPKDQRYENAYVFGAVCPSRDTGVALIMPQADTEAMQAHLNAIGGAVAPGAQALLIPPVQSSTPPRTSGSTCARPISQTRCLPITPKSSTPARTPGASSWPRPAESHLSPTASGQSSVSPSDGWYYAVQDEANTLQRAFDGL